MPFPHVINWFVKLGTCDHRRRKCEYRGHLTIKQIQAVAFSFWRRTGEGIYLISLLRKGGYWLGELPTAAYTFGIMDIIIA